MTDGVTAALGDRRRARSLPLRARRAASRSPTSRSSSNSRRASSRRSSRSTSLPCRARPSRAAWCAATRGCSSSIPEPLLQRVAGHFEVPGLQSPGGTLPPAGAVLRQRAQVHLRLSRPVGGGAGAGGRRGLRMAPGAPRRRKNQGRPLSPRRPRKKQAARRAGRSAARCRAGLAPTCPKRPRASLPSPFRRPPALVPEKPKVIAPEKPKAVAPGRTASWCAPMARPGSRSRTRPTACWCPRSTRRAASAWCAASRPTAS